MRMINCFIDEATWQWFRRIAIKSGYIKTTDDLSSGVAGQVGSAVIEAAYRLALKGGGDLDKH